jgi:hypothetical protein
MVRFIEYGIYSLASVYGVHMILSIIRHKSMPFWGILFVVCSLILAIFHDQISDEGG